MKLSTLLNFKTQLGRLLPLDTASLVNDKLAPILHTVETHEVQFSNLTNRLTGDYQHVIDSLVEFESTVEEIKEEIDKLITNIEPQYYQDSIELYNPTLLHITAESILERKLTLTDELENYIIHRLKTHSNWQHAGLIIRPGHENWIDHLVGFDPLYILDQKKELLDPALLRFNDQYQRRLRAYIIDESKESGYLDALPNKQFGFSLVYNFLNYKPIDVLCRYLDELFEKTKPGGVVALTFNNCDLPGGASLVEYKFMSYTPATIVIEHIKKLGFVIEQSKQLDAACTWLELRKPGKISSIRGGQSLAKIVYKSAETLYNEEEIKKFKQIALDLNIVHQDNIDQVPISQLIEEIKQRIKQ